MGTDPAERTFDGIYINRFSRNRQMRFSKVAPAQFEWNEEKSSINKRKHDIDFETASEVFYESVLIRKSDRNDEERWIAIGVLGNRIVTVAFTRREQTIRIISARRARKNEERDYRNQEVGRPPEGED